MKLKTAKAKARLALAELEAQESTPTFEKKDRVIVNAGTQKDPEWVLATVLRNLPQLKSVEVLYDTTKEKVIEPYDNSGVGVVGFVNPAIKGKRAKPLQLRDLLKFIDDSKWCVPNLKKLAKGIVLKDNKVTPKLEKQHEKIDAKQKS